MMTRDVKLSFYYKFLFIQITAAGDMLKYKLGDADLNG